MLLWFALRLAVYTVKIIVCNSIFKLPPVSALVLAISVAEFYVTAIIGAMLSLSIVVLKLIQGVLIDFCVSKTYLTMVVV